MNTPLPFLSIQKSVSLLALWRMHCSNSKNCQQSVLLSQWLYLESTSFHHFNKFGFTEFLCFKFLLLMISRETYVSEKLYCSKFLPFIVKDTSGMNASEKLNIMAYFHANTVLNPIGISISCLLLSTFTELLQRNSDLSNTDLSF